jgi:hypothetical protein
MPETAVPVAHEADTPQLPQSASPVVPSIEQGGCACGSGTDGATVATRRAPAPP